MELDLNCEPPEPEQPAPAPQDHHRLQRAMLRQEHAFRHQVKDLHRLYWTHKNLPDDVPSWNQSGGVIYAGHSLDGSSQVIDLDDGDDRPATVGGSYQPGKQAVRWGDGVAENSGAEGSVGPGGVQGRSGCRRMIDLEKPATSEDDDDDVEFVSSAEFSVYANRGKGRYLDNSQRRLLENTTHVRSGSTGSSDTPDSRSPIKEKATASGRMLIDLNVANEEAFNGFAHPSKVFCSLLASSSTIQSAESCIESSKGSSITALASISAPDSTREVVAPGFCDPQSSSKAPFHAEGSKHDTPPLRRNIQHHHNTLHDVSGLSSQGSMGVPREVFSVRSSGGNASSVGHRYHQEETLTVVSDDEMGGFDLNVSAGSIELPSTIASSLSENHLHGDGTEKLASSHCFTENEGKKNVSSVESPTVRDHHNADKSVRSPESGITTNRPISVPETPQGRDYACPRLRPSAPNPLDTTTSMHQPGMTEEDEIIIAATAAAETLVSIFTDSSSWIADSRCSNNQADGREEASHDEPQVSLDSFEEGVMNLEQMRDDGDSLPVTRAPDKDGPSCGIKLKRGRGMRDFQREILPGLVSLARHEICDDLHAIGYELRKTRRRNPGDKYSPSTRSRLPRRCSNAWN